ncbi:MAG: hypothetical protein SFX18_11225 [Pirellulales bacterium]|nr:hypothetical protein [Pirellulales bacterium]
MKKCVYSPSPYPWICQLALLVCVIVFSGCGTWQQPILRNQTTPFWEWCVANKFGISTSNGTLVYNKHKNSPTGQLGLIEYLALTSATDPPQAQKAVVAAVTDLQKTAESMGIILAADENLSQNNPGDELTLRYQSSKLRGILTASTEAKESKVSGKTTREFYLKLKLVEEVIARNP